jgi:hypothetical protein
MKSFILKIITLLFLFQISLFAEATKEETINFINEKFNQYGENVYWAKKYKQTKIALTCKSSGVCKLKKWWNQNGSIEYYVKEFGHASNSS